MQPDSIAQFKNLWSGLLYGLVAVLINWYFGANAYGGMFFHFGGIAVIICLLKNGFFAAMIASLISTFSLFVILNNPLIFIILSLEIVFIAGAMRHRIFPLLADILYWLLIGMPITYLLLIYNQSLFDYNKLLLCLKQAINGVLYVSLATIIAPLLPNRWSTIQGSKDPASLTTKIFEYFSTVAAVATLSMGLLQTNMAVQDNLKLINISLQHKANQANAFVTNYIEWHLSRIEELAEELNQQVDLQENSVQLLERTQTNHSGFLTMMVANKDGLTVGGAPPEYYSVLKQLPAHKKNISDRNYFKQAYATGKGFVSQAFLGRGFGEDIIVAVSAPIYKNGNFSGIVEGSLNLNNFSNIEKDVGHQAHESLLIVDQNNQVIYASKDLKMTQLEKFQIDTPQEPFFGHANTMHLTKDGQSHDYFYASLATKRGWKIFVLQETILINTIMQRYYVNLSITFSLIAFLSLIFSRRLAGFLTKPLELIIKHLNHKYIESDLDKKIEYTAETLLLKNQLEQTKKVYLNFQTELKNQVAQKTKDLHFANQKLEQQAREDSLTGLLNRRAFDEFFSIELKKASRTQHHLSLAMIDIDFFKTVNDQCGHPGGDQCLIMVANTLKSRLQRSTDIIARVGGEEFAVLLYLDTAEECRNLLESCRIEIENLVIPCHQNATSITISVGAVFLQVEKSHSTSEIYSRADKMLYQSKNSGRNQVSIQVIKPE